MFLQYLGLIGLNVLSNGLVFLDRLCLPFLRVENSLITEQEYSMPSSIIALLFVLIAPLLGIIIYRKAATGKSQHFAETEEMQQAILDARMYE